MLLGENKISSSDARHEILNGGEANSAGFPLVDNPSSTAFADTCYVIQPVFITQTL